jgi:hypothetical protein
MRSDRTPLNSRHYSLTFTLTAGNGKKTAGRFLGR